MKINMGSTDRILRVIGGIILIGAGIYFRAWWIIFGVLLLVTSAIGYCPLYVPFKICTIGKGKSKDIKPDGS
ncbi:MAG: DUF2892 domain-containing protein [bacterium]|nr:DUF2892 domain-containing protein [bacterium]